MNCKNCDAPLTSNFCSKCGQKADIHRITLRHFLHEFFHAFTHTDKGILLLMKELVWKPGYVAKEYLDGKRKKYFNPLTFLIIVCSLYAYIGYNTGYFEALTMSNRPMDPRAGQVYIESMKVMNENGKAVSLFLMPVIMSALSWLFFVRSKANFAENLVLTSFVLGQIFIVAILVFIPAYLLFPQVPMPINNGVFHILMLGYLTTAYKQFYKQNVFLTAFKAIVINVLFIVLFWFSIAAYVIVRNMILN